MNKFSLIRKTLSEKKLDCVLFLNHIERIDKDFVYFTGVWESFGCLIINKRNSYFLYSNVESHKSDSNFKFIPVKKSLFESIKKLVGKKVGINFRNASYFLVMSLKKMGCKLVDISDDISKIREVKEDYEINYLKKSAKIGSSLMESVLDYINSKKNEKDVLKFIRKKILDFGVTESFIPVVACGNNSKVLHRSVSNRKLKGFVILDMGVKFNNYCSDITRTVYLGNRVSKKEKEDYNLVKDVQKEVSEMSSVSCSELHNFALKKLGSDFIHGLGHGIGIDIHEKPSFFSESKDILKKGSVFTIEPGVYRKNYGIRIEDDYYFNGSKKIEITKVSKKLLIKR